MLLVDVWVATLDQYFGETRIAQPIEDQGWVWWSARRAA